jgi:hypothetical protein
MQTAVPVGVIPPWLWSTVARGSDCCEACWDAHRAAGLPVEADYACCGGACGPDPRVSRASDLPRYRLGEPVANVVGTLVVLGGALAVLSIASAGAKRVRRRSAA